LRKGTTTTNNKQQTTNNKQQTTNNKQQTTNNKHPSPLQNVAIASANRPIAIFARYRKKKCFTSKGHEHD
jgi:hypothetical protein